MFYKSTRGKEKNVKASEAIIRGMAEDGGLYVPEYFPKIDKTFKELEHMDYKELAFYIMKKYFDDFDETELKYCIDKAYDNKFQNNDIAPLKYNSEVYFLELYHGRTLAFKDIALSILPYLLKMAGKRMSITKEIVILTATSGDTGKAALEGFHDVEGTKVIVFYPRSGVSGIQRQQMITDKGENTFVVGIDGNFDDAQSGVKEIFNDTDFNKLLSENGYMLSSANSINIARLVPQIVYYVYSYVSLVKHKKIAQGESINIAVPTGNFGNILAAFYAKNMGIPIEKLICASNDNKVLTDFINTGIYDRNRTFHVTNSPSMDILVSSNLERFLYEISGEDSYIVKNLMKDLKESGKYKISESMKKRLDILCGDFSNEKETLKAIKDVYKSSNYLIDTHTAVAYGVCEKYKNKTGDGNVTIIVSTASPFKFPQSINEALNIENESISDFKLIRSLSNKLNLKLPKELEDLDKKEVYHNVTCGKNEMNKVIKNFLGI